MNGPASPHRWLRWTPWSVYPLTTHQLRLGDHAVHFEGPTGRRLAGERPSSTIVKIAEFLMGVHLMPFEHWTLRWLFATGGLMGCTCIATGLLFFVGKRRRKHAAQGIRGARWVDALAATSVMGMLIATTAILVANRLLPPGSSEHGEWEKRVFWIAWLLALVHAGLRSAPAQGGRVAPTWREQCWAIAALASCAVLLNWVTTGDHLIRTLGRGYWPVAGFDLSLLVTAAVATFAALHLKRYEAGRSPVGQSSSDTLQAEPMHA